MTIREELQKIKCGRGGEATLEQSNAIKSLLGPLKKMKNKVEKLLSVAATEEQAALKILYNAVVKNANTCNSDPSKANIQDWRESQKELEIEIKKLAGKYDIQESGNNSTTDRGTLSSMKECLAYLLGRGYQISQSGLYKHRDEGKFKTDKKTGKYLIKDIDKYAKDHVPLAETGQKASSATDALHHRKLKAEIREKETRADKVEKELAVLNDKYVDREEMFRELVGRALVIDSEARHMIKTTVPEIIELSGGDSSVTPQAIELQLVKLDKMMHSFASTSDFVVDLKIAE